LGLRYQYLNITLSDAEQAAFFERFGSQLEQNIVRGFQLVDTYLARIEFLLRSTKPIVSFGVIIKLKSWYSNDELGHLKYYLLISDDYKLDPTSLIIGERDSLFYFTEDGDDEQFVVPEIEQFVLSENPDRDLHIGGEGKGEDDEWNELGFMLYIDSIPPFE